VFGLAGLAATIARCVRYALASDIESLPNIERHSRQASRAMYRVVIAWLHVVQPFARATGYLRGLWSPPAAAQPPAQHPRSSLADVACTLNLLGRGTIESRFWAERWIGAEALLTLMTDRLRSSRLARTLEIEDGWLTASDIRVPVWPFAWLDLRVLVENHGAGRSLIRIGHRLQPAALSIVAALAIVAWPIARVQGATMVTTSIAGICSVIGVVLSGFALWRITRTLSVARTLIAELAREVDMQPLRTRLPWRFRRSGDTAADRAAVG